MPTYHYSCAECNHEEEIVQKISDSALVQCPKCEKSTFRRGPGGGIGLHFKGSGFYITDYGPKGERCNPSCTNESPKEHSCSPCCQHGACSA